MPIGSSAVTVSVLEEGREAQKKVLDRLRECSAMEKVALRYLKARLMALREDGKRV